MQNQLIHKQLFAELLFKTQDLKSSIDVASPCDNFETNVKYINFVYFNPEVAQQFGLPARWTVRGLTYLKEDPGLDEFAQYKDIDQAAKEAKKLVLEELRDATTIIRATCDTFHFEGDIIKVVHRKPQHEKEPDFKSHKQFISQSPFLADRRWHYARIGTAWVYLQDELSLQRDAFIIPCPLSYSPSKYSKAPEETPPPL